MTLAHLRHEQDRPWRFRVLERTFLLFLIVLVLAGISALITAWTWTGGRWATIIALAVVLAGSVWYRTSLAIAARRSG